MTFLLPSKPKILIIKLRSIGDVIYNTVIYSPIKKSFPDSHLTVVVEPPSYDIVRYHPSIDKVLIFEKKPIINQFKFYLKLIKEQYDVVIDMHEGPRGAGMCFLSFAQFRIGNKFAPRSFVYNTKIDFSELNPKHPIDYQVGLIKKMGVEFDQIQPDIYIPQNTQDQADRILKEKGILDPFCIVHPGSRLNDQWELQKFSDLIGIIVRQFDLKIILTCGPGQEKSVEEIIEKTKNVPIVFIQTELQELASITKRSEFVICHNGGYMHLASSVGTPTVALFGTSRSDIWRTLGKNHVILQHKMDRFQSISVKTLKDRLDKEINYKKLITVEEVLNAINQIMRDSKNRSPVPRF